MSNLKGIIELGLVFLLAFVMGIAYGVTYVLQVSNGGPLGL